MLNMYNCGSLTKKQMKSKQFVDCFMLMGSALSLKEPQKLPEMGRPFLQDVITTFVNISIIVNDIEISSHPNLNVEMDILLTQNWVDPRLGANFKTRKMAVNGQIWKPKILNSNGDRLTSNHEDTVFWRGFGNEGNIVFSEKLKLRAVCTRNYENYPFDTQICSLKFSSYRFPLEEVAILWDLNPVKIYSDIRGNEFKLINVSTLIEVDLRHSGNFSVGVLEFVLKRNPRHYINCIFLPIILITLLNYFSLWLNLNNRSKRLNINLLSFGSFLYYYYVSLCLIQSTPYFKAIDIFVAISILFSLIILLQTLLLERVCSEDEILYHLKKIACNQEYSKYVIWSEFAFKLAYPIFYLFVLIVYSFVFINYEKIN